MRGGETCSARTLGLDHFLLYSPPLTASPRSLFKGRFVLAAVGAIPATAGVRAMSGGEMSLIQKGELCRFLPPPPPPQT